MVTSSLVSDAEVWSSGANAACQRGRRGARVSQIRRPGRSTGVNTSADSAGTLREAGLTDAPFDFEDLFRAQYGRVTSVVSRVVQNPARAEELAVDAFLKLWRTPGAHGPGATVVGAAHGAAIAVSTSCAARPGGPATRRSCDSSGTCRPPGGQRRVRRRTCGALLRVLAAIRREYAALLLLLRSHGCSYDELAAALELKASSVGTLLRRAREAFRKEYIRRHGRT